MLDVKALDIVRLVNLPSRYVTSSWPTSVGLLWIDGDHRYKSVREDIQCWLPHLRPDATVVFDDAVDPRLGPFHVVEELLQSGSWARGQEVGKTKTLLRTQGHSILG